MYEVKVKDRGRDLATHETDQLDEARELARVYEIIGYPAEKISIEPVTREVPKAA